MPTTLNGPDGVRVAHLHMNNFHTVDLAGTVWRCSLLDVVTLGRSMAGLEPLDRLGRRASVLVRHVLKL